MRNSRTFCACVGAIAAVAMTAAPGALAQTGGIPTGGGGSGATTADGTYYDYWFGARDLQTGNAGDDVMTLNWLLRGLALGTPTHGTFDGTTESAVRSFQASAGIASDGVVRAGTRKRLAGKMRKQHASWYGPGFYGNTTACGQKLVKGMVGVAHKKLPCGTRVVFAYKGRWARARVIDRGPYISGRKWDLTYKLAKQLGTLSVGTAAVKAVAAP